MIKMNKYFFYKSNVDFIEYFIQDSIYKLGIVNIPKVYSYNNGTLCMKRINALSVADQYGEDFENVPSHIIEKIRDTIATLYSYGIEYPDITGYNFIYEEDADKLWVIDFEHASYKSKPSKYNPFILEFINGYEGWNPDFK